MGLTKQDVRDVLDVYIKAWQTQDPDLIVTIFTESATLPRAGDGRARSRTGRRSARTGRPRSSRAQANIPCRLLNLYLDGDTAVAEWEAEFDDMAQGVRKRMQEIAVLEFDGPLIAWLREYWASETVPATACRPNFARSNLLPSKLPSSAEDGAMVRTLREVRKDDEGGNAPRQLDQGHRPGT